jgi:uncharacterized coiled-coil protein SlyX
MSLTEMYQEAEPGYEGRKPLRASQLEAIIVKRDERIAELESIGRQQQKQLKGLENAVLHHSKAYQRIFDEKVELKGKLGDAITMLQRTVDFTERTTIYAPVMRFIKEYFDG